MRRAISLLLLCAGLCASAAQAHAPTVADLDAASRATGNRHETAIAVGEELFRSDWPAQIFRVSANAIGNHVIVGLGVYGVKFHETMTRTQFVDQISELAKRAFTAAPEAEEVDIWAVVPIDVGKGVIVTGDLAKPTTRTVFTASIVRGSPDDLLPARLLKGPKTYWDEEWARTAFKQGL